jgi:hypothetical protein
MRLLPEVLCNLKLEAVGEFVSHCLFCCILNAALYLDALLGSAGTRLFLSLLW